jgi:O-antigen ligase
LVVVASAGLYVRSGSKISLLLALGTTLGPLAVYAALRSPLIFPLCAYILVLPFDSLSSLGSGGTLAKILGVLTAAAIFIKVLRRGESVAPPVAVALWIALLIWMGVTMFWALGLHDGIVGFQMYASLIMLFVLLAIVRVEPAEFSAIMGAVVVAGVISASYVAYLYHSGQSLVTANAGVSRVIIAVGDSSIDPNALAAALILPTAIAIYWLFNSGRIALSISMVPVLAVLMLGFAASGSRGGLVELGIVFCYLVVRSRHRLWLLSLMFLAAATTLAANPGLPARFAQAQEDGGAGRRDIWHVGLYALRDYWMTGAGVGNFPNAYDREYIHVYGAQYVLGWHWAAHNVPLMVATELGIVGFSLFVLALVAQFQVLRHLAAGNRSAFELRLTLEGAFLAIVVSGFSTSDLNAKYVWLAFSLMVLYRASLLGVSRNRAGNLRFALKQ